METLIYFIVRFVLIEWFCLKQCGLSFHQDQSKLRLGLIVIKGLFSNSMESGLQLQLLVSF